MDTRLQIRTLGGVTLYFQEQPVAGIISQEALALLIYLARTQREHSRTALAKMFFNGDKPEQANKRLQYLLDNLSGVADTILTITHDKVSILANGNFWLDIAELEHTIQRLTWHIPSTGLSLQNVSELEYVINHYHGDFLDNFNVDSTEFNHWVRIQKDEIRYLVIGTLNQLIDFYILQEDYQMAIAHTTRLLYIDDTNESSYRRMMRLLAICGHKAATVNLYKRYCQRIRADLPSARPSREMESLFKLVRSSDFPKSNQCDNRPR